MKEELRNLLAGCHDGSTAELLDDILCRMKELELTLKQE